MPLRLRSGNNITFCIRSTSVRSIFYLRCFKHAYPPLRGIKRTVAVVSWWVDVVEVIPYCQSYQRLHRLHCLAAIKFLSLLCPIMTPQISSFGTLPCTAKLKPMRTHGSQGALKTSSPMKLMSVSGLRRLHMYTRTDDRGCARKARDMNGANARSSIDAKVRR